MDILAMANQRLYHGTFEIYGQLIRELGIKFFKREGTSPDFGSGFYLTTNRVQAIKWAKQRVDFPIAPTKHMRETLNISMARFSDLEHIPVILNFTIKDTAKWENLRYKYFANPQLEWQKYVWNFRNGICTATAYDWVYGPVGDNGLKESSYRHVRSIPGMDQLSIHTDQASECLTLGEVRRC